MIYLILKGLMVRLRRRADKRLAEFKGLTDRVTRGCRSTFSGSVGRRKRAADDLFDSKRVDCQIAKEGRQRLLNLKDLLTVSREGVVALFRVQSGDGNVPWPICLILKWLMSRWRRRAGEGVLNLKDLLAVFQASRKGSFENEPVWRPPIRAESRQIWLFSRQNAQITAENGGF